MILAKTFAQQPEKKSFAKNRRKSQVAPGSKAVWARWPLSGKIKGYERSPPPQEAWESLLHAVTLLVSMLTSEGSWERLSEKGEARVAQPWIFPWNPLYLMTRSHRAGQ